MIKYVVSEVDEQHKEAGCTERYWYVHKEGFPNIPVWDSFRDSKRKAEYIARKMNENIGIT